MGHVPGDRGLLKLFVNNIYKDATELFKHQNISFLGI